MNILILILLIIFPTLSHATSWKIDDLYTFTTSTNGSAGIVDADSVPTYRIYEDETGTAVLTGSMAKLDDAGTTGFYSEQITLSAANGFEKGKSYNIIICAAISSTTACATEIFQMEMEVDSNTVSGTVPTVTNVTNGVLISDGTGAGQLDTLNGAIVNVDLADTCTALADDAITAAKIAAGAITSSEAPALGDLKWGTYDVVDLTNEGGNANPTVTSFDTNLTWTANFTNTTPQPIIYFPTTTEESTQNSNCNVQGMRTTSTNYNTTTKVVTVNTLPLAPDYRCVFRIY